MDQEDKSLISKPGFPISEALKIQKEQDLNSTEEDLTNPSEAQDNKTII